MKNKLIIIGGLLLLLVIALAARNCSNVNEVVVIQPNKTIIQTLDSIRNAQKQTNIRKDSANAVLDTMSSIKKRKRAKQIFIRRRKEREDHECEGHGG